LLFYDLFWRRRSDPKIKIPKGTEAGFAEAQSDEEQQIKAMIDEFAAEQATKFEQELFKQRKRLADAERGLKTKPTKAAAEHKRIATEKMEATIKRLSDLHRIGTDR